jgi:two-component sensor histidine kinase
VLVARDITRLKTVEENLVQMKEELEARVDDRTRELASINDMLKEEIFERMKTEEKLNASLTEKDILLGEIHHRVKNNLQVIMSLLKLQKNQISDSNALQNFNTAISRIQSIAMIHERLYKSKDLANTEFSDYINHLTHEIVYLHSDYGSTIYLAVNAQNIILDIDRSILCGLILNELILNAIKYAFPEDISNATGRMNKLGIDFYEEGESYVLRTTDNGVGLPPDFNMNDSDTLGMKIINTLVKQLSGTISLSVKEGTEVTIRFPKKKGP